jgi:hypothetical protein
MPLNKMKVRKSLFDSAAPAPAPAAPLPAAPPAAHVPKFMTFDAKLSILLSGDQLDYLEKFVKEVLKQRRTKKERITKNTVFRCLVDLLRALPLALTDIPDEDELRRRLLAVVRK